MGVTCQSVHTYLQPTSHHTMSLASTFRGALGASRQATTTLLRSQVGARRNVSTKQEDVVKYLKKSGIFSDVLPEFTPKVQLHARFLSSGEEAAFGNNMAPVDAQGKPNIEILPFPKEDGLPSDLMGKQAFVVMTDPDAPSRENPEWSEFCHWVASVKLPTSKDGGEVVHNGEHFKELIEYAGPAPPQDTGKHRYLLLLLQGDAKNAEAPSERKKWGNSEQRTGVKQWAEKNGLKPIAANFFYSEAKPEQTVDDIHDSERGLGASGPGYGG